MSGAAAVGAAVGDAAMMGKLIPGRLAGGRAAEVVGGGPTVPHCKECAKARFRYGRLAPARRTSARQHEEQTTCPGGVGGEKILSRLDTFLGALDGPDFASSSSARASP